MIRNLGVIVLMTCSRVDNEFAKTWDFSLILTFTPLVWFLLNLLATAGAVIRLGATSRMLRWFRVAVTE